MDKFLSNSLKGLYPKNKERNTPLEGDFGVIFEENIFTHKKMGEEIEKVQNPIKKRLNDFDANILGESSDSVNCEEFYRLDKEINNVKKEIENSGRKIPENILQRIFPKIYQTKMLRKAVKRLSDLNKMANNLATMKIPYGEQDNTYSNLIDYLSCASSIHAKLKRKMTK